MANKKEFPEKLLIYGVLLTISGFLLLLWTSGIIEGSKLIIPFIIIIPGLYLLYKAFFKGGYERHIIAGMFLTQIGLYILITHTILERSLVSRVWPVFMFMAGVSLIPYSLKKRKGSRMRIMIPASAIIILSLFFLPFSLRLFTTRLLTIAVVWWPLLFIVMGIILLIIFFTRAKNRNKND